MAEAAAKAKNLGLRFLFLLCISTAFLIQTVGAAPPRSSQAAATPGGGGDGGGAQMSTTTTTSAANERYEPVAVLPSAPAPASTVAVASPTLSEASSASSNGGNWGNKVENVADEEPTSITNASESMSAATGAPDSVPPSPVEVQQGRQQPQRRTSGATATSAASRSPPQRGARASQMQLRRESTVANSGGQDGEGLDKERYGTGWAPESGGQKLMSFPAYQTNEQLNRSSSYLPRWISGG